MAISGFAPPIVERWAVEGVGDDDKSTGTSREMSEEGETRTKSLQYRNKELMTSIGNMTRGLKLEY